VVKQKDASIEHGSDFSIDIVVSSSHHCIEKEQVKVPRFHPSRNVKNYPDVWHGPKLSD
jgi:hypothetical protein